MKINILSFFFAIIFSSIVINVSAQPCPPTLTTTPSSFNSAIEGPTGTWTICPGNNVLIESSSASSYQWFHDNVAIDTLTNKTIEAKIPGEYYVMTSSCPTPSEIITIAYFDLATANMEISESPVCTGEVVSVTVTAGAGVKSWFWMEPIVGNSSINPLIDSYTDNTDFTILIQSNDGCASIESLALIVHQPLNPGVISADQSICYNTSPVELTGPSATGGDGSYTYQWESSINSGVDWTNISGATSLNYQPGSLSQTTLFRRVVFTTTPCPAVLQYTPVTITVNEIPTVTSDTAVSICSVEAVNYTPTSYVPGTTFAWTGDNTSGTVTGISPSGTGSINDILSITAGGSVSGTATYTITPTGPSPTFCEGDPFYLVVTILPLPIPTISGDTPVCIGSTGNLYATEPGMDSYGTYVWTIQGGTINSGQGTYEISVTWTATGSQWVRVTYTGANGCDALTPTQYDVTVNTLPDPVITGPSEPCLGASGNVYSTAPGMTNYIWNVSSGGTITGSGSTTDNSAIVTWNTIGTQWISLTYTDGNGCTNTTAKQYFVNVSTPTLSGPQSPCLGSTSNVYTTQSGSGETNYAWTVSAGGTITSGGGVNDNTVTVTWNATGAQTVTVNYTSGAGCTAASPAILNIDVKPLPSPTFISGNNNLCAGTTGVVYTTQSGKSLYTWTISTGGTITTGGTPGSNTATVTWITAGSQQISVNYTDSNGCSAESPTDYPVTVNLQPIPTITGSNSECAGTTGIVYTTESGQSDYDWTISGGTITLGGTSSSNTATVTWTTAGSQSISVNYTDINGCDAATPTQHSVTVLPLPVPTISGSNSVCVDATNVEYTTETGMSGYQWTVPSGGTIVGFSTNDNVFVTWNTVGSHTVSVTYTGTNGCAASSPSSRNVTVNPLPSPTITGSGEVCNNSTGNVYTTQPGMMNYDWVVVGGIVSSDGTSSDNTATVTWNTSGNQSISVNYEQTGCPATSPYVYPVFVNPLPTVDAGPTQSILNGTSTVLDGSASGGTGSLLFQWTPISLIASGETALNPTTENIYVTQIFNLEVTDSKLCAVSDQVQVIALGDPLSVVATATPDEICNNGTTVQLGATSNGGNSSVHADYTWTSTPSGFTSTNQNPSANPTVTTTYNVSVWDGYNTATNTILVTVNPLPTVFTVTGGGEYCSGGAGVSVGLNGSQPGVNYQLLVDGSDIGTPIPGTGSPISFVDNTDAGSYTIHAINGTTACEEDMTGSVTITINPLPTSEAGDAQLIPYGINTALVGVAGAGTPSFNYVWTPISSINGTNTSLTAQTTNLYTDTDFTFTVTDSKGCIASDFVSITLDGSALAVTATAVQDVICNNGETVQLNASATGGNSETQADYSWTSTPSGFTSTEQSPLVNPTQTTLYYISVYDGYNTANNSVTVTVNPLPTAFTVTGGGEYCSGGTGVSLGLNGSQDGISYQLLIDGTNIGSPILGTGAAISFNNLTSAGVYTIYATNIATTCEQNMTGSVSISVNPLPTAFAGDDQTINWGISTSLNGSASSGTSPWNYLWTPDNMIFSGSNTSNPVTENLYATTQFLLTVTDSKGCTDTDPMQVIVEGNPINVVASVDNSTTCSGSDAQLSAAGSGGNLVYTYTWSSNPGSWTSTEKDPAVNPTITTNYTVIIDDGYNTATSSVSINVNPLAAVYDVTGGGSYCSGDSGVEVTLSDSENGVSYQLYMDGTPVGAAVSGTGSSISFGDQTAAGSYTVKATVVITGCENDMTASVDVNILPLPDIFEMTGGGSYPQGGIGVPVALTNSQIGVNYQLLLNGSDIGSPLAGTGSPLNFGYQTEAGDYTAVGTDAVWCTIEMDSTVSVVINPYPSIFNVYGGDTICDGSSTEVGLDGSEIAVAYTLLRGEISVLVDVPGTGDSLHFGEFSTQGIYTVRAKNIATGLTMDMDGNAEIIVNDLPNPYSLSYFQPGDNCVPIIPHLGGSEIGATYELNYEDFNGYYTPAIETISGTGNPINFSSQTNSGTYTASAYIDYTGISCSIDMHGSLIADSIPKEFQITPQGQLCENDQDLCLVGSEAGINYRLWLNSQPVGSIVPGDINGGPICFGTLSEPGTYRIYAINTITGCEIFFTEEVVVNPQPIKYVMAPVTDCAGSEIILQECEDEIDYYLYLEPASKEFIEVQGPLTCSGSGPINFGPQFDEGIYRIKAVNPSTNCWAWMDGTTTIYPNPEVFEISPQEGGCAPLEIYLENFEADATYYLYRDLTTLVSSIAGSTGSVNFGLQSIAGTYTVKAQLAHPGGVKCWSYMSGEVNIYDAATVYTLTPAGPSCPDPDVQFYLSGSESGVDYTLRHDVSGIVETISGTGAILNFSPQTEPGQYWVIASTGNACETQMEDIGIINEIPTLYSITPIGQLCSDDNVEIGLNNSDIGVTYQLILDNTVINPQSEIIGTGSAIVFGNFSNPGTYTVLAIDDVTACERWMDGELILNDPPNIYTVLVNGAVPTVGWYCSPATIGLELSQTGVDYTLHTPDGNDVTMAGITGVPIEFGDFTYPGEYSVTAFNSTTSCSSDMEGVVNIYDNPEVLDLVSLTDPLYCAGDDLAIELVLSYSQIGASYQLFNDAISVFDPQIGTGGPLTWTAVSQYGPGDYYVKASFIDDPTCSAVMNGVISVEEIELPTATLSGTETICYGYCTNIEFNLTGTLPFEVYYTANNILQDPVYFTPGNQPFLFEVCPIENTTYEIESIQYTEFPYCEGTDISGTLDVVVEPLPVIVDMGSPATTCITEPYTTDIIEENTSAYSWVILGTPNGSIFPTNTLNTTYTPGAGDEETTVQLQLTVFGEGSCVTETTTSILDILIDPIPVIAQLDGGTICETGSFSTNVSVDFASSYFWEVVTGNGTVSPDDEMNTTYTAATGDGGTTVVLQITATGSGTCSNVEVIGQIEIIVEPLPTANAGLGGTICESETFQLNGSATYFDPTTVLWEVIDGVGTIAYPMSLQTVFTPGEISQITSMTLRLTVVGDGTCNNETASSEVIIQVDPMPEAYAGEPGFICETQGFHLAYATVANSSYFVWDIYDGQGHFDDPLMLTPVFYPDPVDEVTEMTLMLTAYGQDECINSTDISYVTVQVDPDPYAYAGTNGETCLSIPYLLFDSDALNFSMLLWEVVSGYGDVDFPVNQLHPSYIPDELDADSYVTLRLTAFGDGECSDLEDYSLVNIFIQGLPEAYAGPNLVTCFSESIQITQAVASTESINWVIASGNGILDNPTIINPTYTPGVGDEGTSVLLTLNVTGDGTCGSEVVQSQMEIQVDALPTAFAGDNGTTCATDAYLLEDATAQNSEYVIWSVISGNGYIEDPFFLNTQYISSAFDAGNTVRLRLAAYGEGACGSSYAESFIDIDVIASPVAYFTSTSPACENEAINFTDQSTTQEGTIDQWEWDFGDGQTSSEQNPENVYVSDGDFSVILTVTNTNGCTASYTSEVTVSPLPVASFNYSGDLCSLSPIFFNDLSQTDGGVITSWSWNFGDPDSGPNNTSELQNPYHIFIGEMPTNGYTVSLTVTNSQGCSDMIQLEVIVYEAVEIDFTAADEPFCIEEVIQFTSTGVDIVSWDWNFGDGGTSNEPDPEYAYPNAGNYTVSLLVINTYGCEGYVEHEIIVNEDPVAAFSTSSPVCLGSSIEFLNYSTSPTGYITEWVWDFGDGNDTIVYGPNPNVSHTYELANTYQPTLTVTNSNGCSSSIYHEVIIRPGPIAAFDYSGTCAGSPVSFIDLSQENGGGVITSWSWDFGDEPSGVNNTSNFQNPSHIYSTPGSYFVDLIIENANGCTDTILDQEVIVTDYLLVEIQVDNDSICLDEPINFEAIATDAVTWQWDFGDGSSPSTTQNPTHIYTETGNFLVTLTAETADGCQGYADTLIVVNESPVANFSTDSPSCVGTPTIFIDQSYVEYGYIDTWIWAYGDGSANDTIFFPNNPNTTHLYTQEGTFNVTLTTISAQGCIASLTKEVEVNPSPIANFNFTNACQNMLVNFTDNSTPNNPGNIISWFWRFDDPLSGTANTSELQNPSHIFTEAGDYDVMLIIENYNQCFDTDTNTVTVNPEPDVEYYWDLTCENQLTHFFIDTDITNMATITDHVWDFGDGQTSSAQDPEHLYVVPGEYTVILTVTDVEGCENSVSHIIDVHPTPVVGFSYSSPACQNSDIQFTDNTSPASGYVVQWIWDMGDGTTYTVDYPDSPDITHTYLTSGTFQVDLWVITTDSCENSASQNVIIVDSPLADFEFEDACGDQPVQFTDNSTAVGAYAISQWAWDFGDLASGNNNYSSTQNPIHSFTQAGVYDVSLIVFNSYGCSGTSIQQVVSAELPPVDFITSTPTCFDDLTYFYADSILIDIGSIVIFEWNFGDGSPTSNQQNPVYMYLTTGNFNVILSVVDTGGCENSISHIVTISPKPQAIFDYTNACQSDTTYFTDYSSSGNGDPITEWAWDFGDPTSGSNTSVLQNPIHVYENIGTYQVQLVVTCLSGCTDSLSREVIVNPLPTANFNYSVDACQSGLVYFTDSSYAFQTSIAEWFWTFEPGYNSTLRNPIHDYYTVDTCYEVSLMVTDGRGCQQTFVDTVCIPAGLEFDFTYSQTCFGQTTSFTPQLNNPPGDTLILFNWDFGDIASGINNTSNIEFPTHNFTSPGAYTVSLEAMDQFGCSLTIYNQIIVENLPIPDFTYESNICDSLVYFDDLSDGNGAPIQSWTWIFGDGTPNETIVAPANPDIPHAYSNPGFYDVSLVVLNINGCQDTISKEIFREYCIRADFAVLDTLLCQNFILNFFDSSIYSDIISQWYWNFGDGYDTTYNEHCPVITHAFVMPGTFEIRLIIYSNIGAETISDTIIKSIIVLPSPIADFSCNAVCFNEISYFNDISNTNGTELISWLWNFNYPDSADSSNEQNPWYQYNIADSFDVKLYITAENACYDSIIKTVAVNPLPVADFEWINACMSKSTNFTDISDGINGIITNWGWNFGDSLTRKDTSSFANPYYIYDSTGAYDVRLIVSNEHTCIDTSIQAVTVYPVPYSNFSFVENYDNVQGQLQFTNETQGGVDYFWLFGDGGDSEETDPQYQYDADGNYIIELISWNEYDCPDTMSFIYQFLFKGLFVPNAFSPDNPTSEVRVFQPKGVNLLQYDIKIYDNWGHLLWQSQELDAAGCPSESWDGMYNGELMPMDVYLWRIKATFVDGSVWEGKSVGNNENGALETTGTVTLIR